MAETYQRGAKPSPLHRLAGATPHRAVAAAPAQLLVMPPRLSMWHNDVDGDCVTAEEAAAKAFAAVLVGQPETFISNETVLAWASKHGVLNGAVITDVLDWMQTDGFRQDGMVCNDGPHVSVDWTSAVLLQNAISRGPVKIGVAADQLQAVVRGRNGWLGVGFHRDANLDHCVALVGYGSVAWLAEQFGVAVPAGVPSTLPAYALFTWGTVGIITADSMIAITGEAWLRQPTTVVVGPPTPQPIPTPQPVPVTPTQVQVQAWVDQAFHMLEAKYPQYRAFLQQTNQLIDQYLAGIVPKQGVHDGIARLLERHVKYAPVNGRWELGVKWQQLLTDFQKVLPALLQLVEVLVKLR